jgi:TonB family protein
MLGMKKLLGFLSLTLLSACLMKPASAQMASPEVWPQASGLNVGVDLLSDTGGANFGPYAKTLISDVKRHWIQLMAERVGPSDMKQQETLIVVTIGSDGRVLAMRLDEEARGGAFERAAWEAAKETSYEPLPAGMKEQSMKFRVHFRFN